MSKVEMHVVFVTVFYMLAAMFAASWYYTTDEGKIWRYSVTPVITIAIESVRNIDAHCAPLRPSLAYEVT